MIEFRVFDDGVIHALGELAKSLKDFRPVWRRIQIGRRLSEAFRSQGQDLGKKWARRKPRKGRRGTRNRPLELTGDLRRALSKPRGEFRETYASWKIDTDHGHFIQYGTKLMKPRLIIGWSGDMQKDLNRELEAWASREIKRLKLG